MSDKRIVYENAEGGVSIIVPAAECGLTVEQIAAKDTPTGTPYWIVDVSEIPSDREFRNAWQLDESLGDPSGIGE